MKNSIKLGKHTKHFAHISIPYNEDTRPLFFVPYTEQAYDVYKDGKYIDTSRFNREFKEDMESIGFELKPKRHTREYAKKEILGYEVAINKIPNTRSPKQISILISAETVDELQTRKLNIITHIKTHCDVNINHDMWIDNCEVSK